MLAPALTRVGGIRNGAGAHVLGHEVVVGQPPGWWRSDGNWAVAANWRFLSLGRRIRSCGLEVGRGNRPGRRGRKLSYVRSEGVDTARGVDAGW